MKERLKRLGKRLWEENTAWEDVDLGSAVPDELALARRCLADVVGLEPDGVVVRRTLKLAQGGAREIELGFELREEHGETHVEITATARDPGTGGIVLRRPPETPELVQTFDAVRAGILEARPAARRRAKGVFERIGAAVVLDLPADDAAERCLAAADSAGYAYDRLLTWGSVSAPGRPRRGYTLTVTLLPERSGRSAHVGAMALPWLSAADKTRMRADVADVAARLRSRLSS